MKIQDVAPHPDETGNGFHSPSSREIGRAANLFKVLAHPDRLRLACRLGHGGTATQKELVEELGWPQSTTARHLQALRRAGLVDGEREGAEVLLRMGSPVGLELMEIVCEWLQAAEGVKEATA